MPTNYYSCLIIIERGEGMSIQRRKCKLSETKHEDIDLRQFEELIIGTVNSTVSGKNPKVFKDYFSTDVLSQSEAVLLGRALAKLDELKVYGKTVTIFRLFDGKVYDSESSSKPVKKNKGGRVR